MPDYSDASGWHDLSSGRDLDLIREALERQGFHQICQLRDGEPTAPGGHVLGHVSGQARGGQ